MAILTPDALPSNVRFNTDTSEIYEVDGNGDEVSGTRSAVAEDVALLISDRNSWQSAETAKVASQIANTTNTNLITLGGIATLNAKIYSARLPVPANFSVVSISVSAGTAGSGNCQFRVLNKGSAISSSMTLASGATNYTVVPTNTSSTGPVSISGSATDNYLQLEVTSIGETAPRNVTFSLRISG
jgi:hypothetical protein